MKRNVLLILLFFLFFCIFHTYTLGQAKIDSLKTLANSSKNSVKTLDASLELAHILLTIGNDETKKYLDKAEKLLINFPDNIKIIKLNIDIANYYTYTGEYKKSAKYYLKAINLAEKIGNNELKNSALNGLAQLNIRSQNYKKGISIFQELLDYSIKTDNKDDIIQYSLNLAMANGDAGNLDKAEKYLLDVYKSNPKNQFYKAVAANGLSFIYNNKKEYTKAYKYAKAAKKFSRNNQIVDFKIENLTNYSNALKGLGKNKEAEKLMFKILELARKSNYIRKENNEIGNIALNYADMGNYELAYKYYKKFSEQKDSLLNESTNAKINDLQIKYETERKDKELTKKTAALREQKIFLTYSVLGVILLLIVSSIIFFLYKDKNSAYKELVRKNLEIIRKENEMIVEREKVLESNKAKYKSSALSDNKKQELRAKLETEMTNKKKFMQQTISLGKLAQDLNVNSKYLSQVIHEFYSMSFTDFINQLRIKEAAKLLSDKAYSNITIEGISELVGFHTKSSFNIYFKKYMGVTPSFFSTTSLKINDNSPN